MKKTFFFLIVTVIFMVSCQQKPVEKLMADGLSAFNEKNYEKSVEMFTEAIGDGSGMPELYFNRGNAYALMGNSEAALADFNKAIELKSDYAAAYHNRAYYILEKQGDLQGALTDYTQSIELLSDDNDAYALNNRSLIKMKLMDTVGAMKDVNMSIGLDPQNPYAYRNRALIYLQMSKTDSACIDLKRSIQLGFSDPKGSEIDSLLNFLCK